MSVINNIIDFIIPPREKIPLRIHRITFTTIALLNVLKLIQSTTQDTDITFHIPEDEDRHIAISTTSANIQINARRS